MSRVALAAAVALATLAAARPLAAQSSSPSPGRAPGLRAYTVSLGVAPQHGEPDAHVNRTRRGPLVGGTEPGPHVALGAAFRVRRVPAEVRAEAFYNELRGPKNAMLGTRTGESARMASRDRVFAAGAVLLWRMRPRHLFGPYLMTGGALYHTRLTSAPVYEDARPLRVSGTALGASVGAGVELPVYGRTWFMELRPHFVAQGGIRGGTFMPLTVGTRF